MGDSPREIGELHGVELRLHELLDLLRAEPPEPPAILAQRVIESARWERGVRTTSHALGGFGLSLIEGLAVLLGVRRRQP